MNSQTKTPYFSDWPKIQSAIAPDPSIERKITEILSQMTLEEKIGQMVQPEIRGITAEELKEFKIGSILNGGGAWPNEDKHASALDWASKSDEFWHATQEMYADRPFTIPFMWATDAVHGHNNVYGATVFPHNIGLGCARDPELIERIGRVTALEIVATGLDWTFAPTVATPRDLRWGRVYEGYSEDPQITYQYARAMVRGLQGTSDDLKGDEHVISNVKHWVGDGGTTTGVDRGINHYSEDLLRNIHAMGYFSGLEAGAQVVMSSFNSWVSDANYDQDEASSEQYNYKVHGSKYLINDVLKEKMGFDGLVVTDWHGHAEVNKCTDGDANYAINAGNDVLMVPIRHHWQAVYRSALQGVRDGSISMSRIDDAVTRILRVKMRANLWHKPAPTERRYGGKQAMLGALNHREVAREAVRKSMVLLKNKQGILPLKQNQTVLLTGSAANDIQKQSGGWNLTWQGDENDLSDFPGATTLKMALEQTLGKDNVRFDPDLTSQLKAGDIAVVAFGEDPYAEMMGDIKAWQTLEYARLKRSYARDCQLIRQLHDAGVKVISIFFSGRPLYLNEEISKSDAFVAAFLPGSEGEGMTDVLVANAQGEPSYDFVGQLSYSWPNKKSSATVNTLPAHIPNYQVPENEQSPLGEHAPLFDYGYGLNYSDRIQDNDLDNLTLDVADDGEVENATQAEHLYGIRATIGDYQLKVADATHWMGVDVSRNNAMELDEVLTKPYNYQQQQDAVELTLMRGDSYVYIQTGDGLAADFSQFKRHGSLSFEIKLLEVPSEPLYLGVQRASSPELQSSLEKYDLSPLIGNQMGEFITLRIECADFLSNDSNFTALDTPFVLFTEGSARFVLANICWNAS